jgi:serine/threonine-protein kinase
VSPQNVFVTYDGQVKVLDFGTAKVANAATHTRTGLVKGKLGYMPPEQLLSEKLDRRADVFAVGCMLWEAAVGGRLWGKLREGEIAHRLLHGQIPRPEGGRDVDPELEAIIMKALAPNKDDRYPSALALQQDLEAYLMSHHPVGSARDVSKFVSELFAEDRQERARVVNAALQDGIREAAVAESIVPAAPETVNTGVTTTKRGVRANRFAVMLVVPIALTLGAVVVTRGLGASRVPAPDATVTAAPQLVHIGIRAIPAEAKLTLDGKPLASNPARIEVPEDGVDHLVRAEAPGFRPLERIVRFSGDADIILKLESEEGEATDAAAPVATESPGEDRPKAKSRAYVPRRPAAPATAAPAKPASPHCDPPFVFINGVKAYKPECL